MDIQAQLLAFPTAEGYGAYAIGGRGGRVVEVTNLDDNFATPLEGSLRWALQQHPDEPLTVVFRISGVIDLKAELRCSRSNYTIAGQTAPGDGICIKGHKVNLGGSKNLIIRHLRFRIGVMLKADGTPDASGKGSIGIENASDLIIDHCTFGWSAEENMTMYDNNRTTVQWCIVHEGLYNSGHNKGVRSYGTQWGGQTATYHHNLLANNVSRTPRFNGARSNDNNVLINYVNNVNYNWGKSNSCYGGDIERNTHKVNFVNNYYKPGPARPGTSSSFFVQSSVSTNQTAGAVAVWYMSGNIMEGSANVAKNTDNYVGLDASGYTSKGISADALKSATPFLVPYPVTTETAEEAYKSVLAKAGAFPRDAVDTRIVDEVKTGTATGKGTVEFYFSNDVQSTSSYYNKTLGIIDNPEAVGGYPTYNTFNELIDTDHDGMPDVWEIVNGLNSNDPSDGNKITKSGYTALEVYLNSLVGEDIPLLFDEASITKLKGNKDIQAVVSGDFLCLNTALSLSNVEVYDMQGGSLLLTQGRDIHSLNIKNIPTGIYLAKVKTADGKQLSLKFRK